MAAVPKTNGSGQITWTAPNPSNDNNLYCPVLPDLSWLLHGTGNQGVSSFPNPMHEAGDTAAEGLPDLSGLQTGVTTGASSSFEESQTSFSWEDTSGFAVQGNSGKTYSTIGTQTVEQESTNTTTLPTYADQTQMSSSHLLSSGTTENIANKGASKALQKRIKPPQAVSKHSMQLRKKKAAQTLAELSVISTNSSSHSKNLSHRVKKASSKALNPSRNTNDSTSHSKKLKHRVKKASSNQRYAKQQHPNFHAISEEFRKNVKDKTIVPSYKVGWWQTRPPRGEQTVRTLQITTNELPGEKRKKKDWTAESLTQNTLYNKDGTTRDNQLDTVAREAIRKMIDLWNEHPTYE